MVQMFSQAKSFHSHQHSSPSSSRILRGQQENVIQRSHSRDSWKVCSHRYGGRCERACLYHYSKRGRPRPPQGQAFSRHDSKRALSWCWSWSAPASKARQKAESSGCISNIIYRHQTFPSSSKVHRQKSRARQQALCRLWSSKQSSLTWLWSRSLSPSWHTVGQTQRSRLEKHC